ncbi:unnamed protein product [Pelagomonas calceolata]|uniref:Uncharacterized protein n=1 Tax=Pelagomonas calceolata TaxID=35677 RepID=A0A8J2SU02_9STRA|nr:unnamed protein product [Pelagomonas calceolata]
MAARVLPLLEDGLRSPRSQEGSSPQSKGSPLSKTRESRWAEAPTERLRPAHARRPSFLGELDAPARRPSLLGGRSPSKRSVDSLRHYQLGKVGKAENMWELERPKNAAERLLRKYMERNTGNKKEAVSIASRLDVGEAAKYAHVERPTTPYYGVDGETTQRRPPTCDKNARRIVVEPVQRNDSSDSSDEESVFNRRLSSNTYDKFAARRAQRFATARGRVKREVMRDEERKRVADSKVQAKKALRKMRSLELERQKAKELELLKSGPPKEKTLDERKHDLSQSLKGMVKTYEKCERRAKRKDGKAAKRIQRTWRGYKARKETGDVCFKARFVTGFFKTEEVYVSEDEESFEPELYDPVCATIQRAWRRYRKRMLKRYFYAARLAMLWRARRNLKIRKARAAQLRYGRKESSRRFVKCVRRFLSRKLREWRQASIEVKRAKWNLRRAQALIAIAKGLKGYYAKRQRKQQLAASLRVSGAPEVQGAVATFLVDDDWPKCLATLDDGLADSDDENDARASHFVPTRFARNPPSVREYRSINHGDDRLLQCAFWDFVTDVSERTLQKDARRRVRRQQQRADEAKVLVDSFVRGLRREAFDADADKDTIVEHLPDDADLWRVPAMDRFSTIKARTLYDERAKSAPPPMDRGYKLRWVWDGELCGACGAIVPNFLRARSCRTCGARTPLAADRPTLAFKPAVPPPIPCKALDVQQKATTLLIHAHLVSLSGAPGSGWRRRRVPFAKLWRAAVASTVDARAELRALNVASIADLVKRGGCSVLSPAHTELAHEADHLLKLLDDALRARQKADEKAAARRRLQENN